MLNFDRSTVKKLGTHNSQNDCHQCLSDSLSAPNSFSAGAPSRTTLGSLQRSRDPLAGLMGLRLREEGGRGRREKGGKRRGREEQGTGEPPPFRKSVDLPLTMLMHCFFLLLIVNVTLA